MVGERDLNARASADVDRFSIVVDCIKPAGDMDQLCMSFIKDVNSHPKAVHYENYYTKNVPGNCQRFNMHVLRACCGLVELVELVTYFRCNNPPR